MESDHRCTSRIYFDNAVDNMTLTLLLSLEVTNIRACKTNKLRTIARTADCDLCSDGVVSLLHQGLWEPEFYGDLVYKLTKIVGSNNLSA